MAELLLGTDVPLVQQLRTLTEQRRSFPISGAYEWRGSRKDVVTAANGPSEVVRRATLHAPSAVTIDRLGKLEEALSGLSDN